MPDDLSRVNDRGQMALGAAVFRRSELDRLAEVMSTLRSRCPWDARQTHRSLVPYLIEETFEVVEAVESGSATDLREELGDLLLQVYFHSQIASESTAGFDLQDVARGIADKLVDRHPHVFGPSTGSGHGNATPESREAPLPEPVDGPFTESREATLPDPVEGPELDADAVLAELNVSWEQRKAVEKGRTSVLEGIPSSLSAMARATKIIGRARARGVVLDLPTVPVEEADLGAAVLSLVARAQATGIDAEQAVRDAVRELETSVLAAEAGQRTAAREVGASEVPETEVEDGPR